MDSKIKESHGKSQLKEKEIKSTLDLLQVFITPPASCKI